MAIAVYTSTVFRGSKGGKVVKAQAQYQLQYGQVLVKVTHSGLCGTDTHMKERDIVLGHEGVGIVQEVGEGCRRLKKGDHVGWGYQHESCGQCSQCLSGTETFCPSRHFYGVHGLDRGSMSTTTIWSESFLFSIPSSIPLSAAAPLMCGGSTVFSALYNYNVRPNDTVGIVGIGGLGHLGIQFAAKMGCEVIVFSSTEAKKEEALALGASEFYATRGVKSLKGVVGGRKINHLLVTASFQPDWGMYFELMAPNATIYPLTVSEGPLSLPYMGLLDQGLRVVGSIVASRFVQNQMLQFAARHSIRPIIEEFPMTEKGIEDAFERLESGDMRYRAVLVPSYE